MVGSKKYIRNLRKEKEIGAEIKLTEDAPVSWMAYFFPLFLVTVPEVFAKFNSAQFLSRF